ncbi:MAG TPA: hypothetical protein VML50_08410 [Anaeromyxobacter sp.]|nr:hypothetical protein [Anaeromyxobacter sp.]
MRVLLATGIAIFLIVAAGAPHVHGARGAQDCAVCVARAAEPLGDPTTDLQPIRAFATPIPPAPGLAPVHGAPLGAIPGQSPPTA